MPLDTRQLQNAATAVGNGSAVYIGAQARRSTVYLRGTGTIVSGSIVIEEASDLLFSGTWSSLVTVAASTLSGGVETAVHIDAVVGAVRARVSVAIGGGGNVSANVLGR